MRILIVDDEEISLNSVRNLLKWKGIREVDICQHGGEAIERIKSSDYDVVLLDLLMPEVDGLQVLESTKPFKPHTEFIILTAVDDIPTTVKAMRLGAYDYLVKPVDNDRLVLSIERAFERKGLHIGLSVAGNTKLAAIPPAFSPMVTQSPGMLTLISYAQVMARSGNPILITGESGTGKELMARGIHDYILPASAPFVAVNVSAIPETMFETQFFGHTRGAFTGAEANYRGYFEQADGGTLFLDEIGEMPLALQTRLLRVLEEKSFTPLGGMKAVQVDVRVISATNLDLDKACQQGKFRLDLMYRLNSARIHLPPLRERPGDIPLLASHFLRKACLRHGKDILGFSPDVIEEMCALTFPGNVRELSQIVENAVLMADTNIILPHHLSHVPNRPLSFSRRLCSFKEDDEDHLAYVLIQTGGDRRRAAQVLGVTIRQLQRRIARLRENPRWSHISEDN